MTMPIGDATSESYNAISLLKNHPGLGLEHEKRVSTFCMERQGPPEVSMDGCSCASYNEPKGWSGRCDSRT
jgi:hypothetical protein